MFSVQGPDGQVYGPVDTATIREWIAQGRVTPETILVDSVTDRQAPARDVLELADAFAQPRPTAGPPIGTATAGTAMGTRDATSAGYGAASYPAYAPMAPQVSSRSKVVAILLAFFLGALGIHRFYLGYNTIGLIMLLGCVLTCGFGGIITSIVAIIDLIMIATGSLKDFEGRDLAA